MKVLAISGSPRPQGNTRLLLETALKVLEGHGIATEYLSLHGKDIRPCLACMKCAKDKNRCAQEDDFMPVFEAMAAADGLIVGSPVYFGSATPNLMALLDRAGYVARQGDNRLRPQGGQPHRGGPAGRGQFHLRPTAVLVLHHGDVRAGLQLLAHRLRPQTRRRGQRRRGPQDRHRPGGQYGLAAEEAGQINYSPPMA